MNKRISSFLFDILFALWWGGFTFYAAVVVPKGMTVLGDHVKMGLITQSVTNHLNGIGAFALITSIFLLMLNQSKEKSYLQAIRWEWLLLVLFQGILFYLHCKLSEMISINFSEVLLKEGFYSLHRIYLLISTAIWVLMPIHYYQVKNSLKQSL